MHQRLKTAQAWIDERSLRERVLLFAAAAAVLVGGFWSLLDQLGQERNRLSEERRRLESEQQVAEVRLQALLRELSIDPSIPLRAQAIELQRRSAQLKEQLAAAQRLLIPGEAMGQVLHELLANHPEVQLVSLKSLPPTRLGGEGQHNEPKERTPLLYRRGVEVVVEGTYQALLAYVEAIEAGHQRFLWGSVRFAVVEHPRLRMVLTLYTLSTDPNWLTV